MRATTVDDSQLIRQTPQCLHNLKYKVRSLSAGVLMNRSTLAALVVALMLGSGITGYLIGKPGDSVDQAPPPPRTATTAPPAAAPPAPPPAAPSAAPAATPTRSMAPTPAAPPATAPSDRCACRRGASDSSRT